MAVLSWSAGPVAAHAELLEVTPADGAVVAEAPNIVTLRFNEPVSLVGGSARVLDDEGVVVSGAESVAGEAVTVPLSAGLDAGTYTVSWQIISADSHRLSGATVFHVGAPSPDGGAVVESGGDGELPWALRAGTTVLVALAYGAALLAVGLAWFATFVAPLPDRDGPVWRVVVRKAGIIGIVALVVALPARTARLGGGADALGDGEFLAETLRGPLGVSTVVTVIGLIAVVALVGGRRPAPTPVLAIAGLVTLAGFAIEGHTRTMQPLGLMVAFDVVHLVAGAIWLGGIAGLIIAFRRGIESARLAVVVRRFSTAALASVVVLAAAGIGMSVIVLPAPSDLWSTSYGLALLTKVTLVAVVVALGAYNRRRLVPVVDGGAASPHARERLGRVVRVELGVLIAVVVVTAVLVGRSPTESQAAPTEPPSTAGRSSTVEVLLSAGAGSVRVDGLPGATGSFELSLALTDAGGGPLVPVQVPTVQLRERQLSLGPLDLEVHAVGDGAFHVFGDVPVPGSWELEVKVRLTDFDQATATVPLAVR